MTYKKVHPLVDLIIYGDIDETPWDVLGHDLTDVPKHMEFVNSLDEEQILRLNIAATVQKWIEENNV